MRSARCESAGGQQGWALGEAVTAGAQPGLWAAGFPSVRLSALGLRHVLSVLGRCQLCQLSCASPCCPTELLLDGGPGAWPGPGQ